jgi:EmrB/QacA subfamily drug resistance transporter
MPPVSHPRRWWILGVLILSLLTVSLDNTVLNVALPTISQELGATTGELQWMVDAYVLVFAGLLLTAGAVGDRLGRRRLMLSGLVLLGGGAMASSLASAPVQLILLRAVMGLGAALVMPSTLSILSSVFSPDQRPKAIAAWTAVAGLGIVAGPVIAGWLLEHASWTSIFLVNVPVVAAAIVATLVIVPESRDTSRGLDPVASGLSMAGLIALVWSIIEAPGRGWLAPEIVGPFVGAVILLAAFVIWELRAPAPMLDVRLFGTPAFSAAVLAITLSSFGLFGSVFFLTQYMQVVLGYATLETGVKILPLAVAMAVASPLSAVLAGRLGTRSVVAGGLVLTALGLVVLSHASVDGGYGPVAITLALFGAGMGLSMTPVTSVMIAALPRGRAGIASALNGTTREIGGALGVAVLGSIATPIYSDHVASIAQALPAPAGEVVRGSVAGAAAVAAQLPAGMGAGVLDAARLAFVSGMDVAVLAGAVVTLAGAVVAFTQLPARASRMSPPVEGLAANEALA